MEQRDSKSSDAKNAFFVKEETILSYKLWLCVSVVG